MKNSDYYKDYYIKPCPICNRKPKIKVLSYDKDFYTLVAQCKRLFRKPHLIVEYHDRYRYSDISYRPVIDMWNNKCTEIAYEKLKIFKCKVED